MLPCSLFIAECTVAFFFLALRLLPLPVPPWLPCGAGASQSRENSVYLAPAVRKALDLESGLMISDNDCCGHPFYDVYRKPQNQCFAVGQGAVPFGSPPQRLQEARRLVQPSEHPPS